MSSATASTIAIRADLSAQGLRRRPSLSLPHCRLIRGNAPYGFSCDLVHRRDVPHGRPVASSAAAATTALPSPGSIVRDVIPHGRSRGLVRGGDDLPGVSWPRPPPRAVLPTLPRHDLICDDIPHGHPRGARPCPWRRRPPRPSCGLVRSSSPGSSSPPQPCLQRHVPARPTSLAPAGRCRPRSQACRPTPPVWPPLNR